MIRVFLITFLFPLFSWSEPCLERGEVGVIENTQCIIEFKDAYGRNQFYYFDNETACSDKNLQCSLFLFGEGLCLKELPKANSTLACFNQFEKEWDESLKIKDEQVRMDIRSKRMSGFNRMKLSAPKFLRDLQASGLCLKQKKLCTKIYTHIKFLEALENNGAIPFAKMIEYPKIINPESPTPSVLIKNHDYGDRGHTYFSLYYEKTKSESPIENIVLPKLVTEEEVENLKYKPLSLDEERELCLDEIRSYFKNSKDLSDEEIQKYMKIQAKLTLNRLAWTHLNILSKNGDIKAKDKKKYKVENTITNLIKSKLDRAEAYYRFDEITSKDMATRKYLFETLDEYKDVLKDNTGADKKDLPFKLNLSDIKMLSILKEREKSGAYKPGTVLNLSKIINSSYLSGKKNRLANQSLRMRNQKILEKEVKKIERKMNSDLENLVLEKCLNNRVCHQEAKKEFAQKLFPNMLDIFNSITSGLELRSDTDLHKSLQFNSLWLRTTKQAK